MNELDREAMCYVAGKLATERMPFILPAIFGERTATWTDLMGCTEQQILDSLAQYHLRALGRQVTAIKEGGTRVSQDMARLAEAFSAAGEGDRFAAERARRTWERVQDAAA